eukprot:1461740-Pyramimonas_sp.AAC.1
MAASVANRVAPVGPHLQDPIQFGFGRVDDPSAAAHNPFQAVKIRYPGIPEWKRPRTRASSDVPLTDRPQAVPRDVSVRPLLRPRASPSAAARLAAKKASNDQ